MKKLVVFSFSFVLMLMLVTNVFSARTLEITDYYGESGLLERGTGNEIGEGDTLNIVNDFIQEPYISGYEQNMILGKGIKINGNNHTLDGAGHDGFKMQPYSSSYAITESVFNNATLTNYGSGSSYSGVIELFGDDCYPKLTLKDVDIIENNCKSIMVGQFSTVDVVASNKVVEIYNNLGIDVTYGGTLNFKGGEIYVEDFIGVDDAFLNNSATLYSYGIGLDGQSIFNNYKKLVSGDIHVLTGSSLFNYGTIDSLGSIGGNGVINSSGTINLYGNTENFGGSVIVENGTIKVIINESNWGQYFNNATYHEYKNGTLDVANGMPFDQVNFQSLYIRKGDMKINFDVDLLERISDTFSFEAVNAEEYGEQDKPENIIILNDIKVLRDSAEQAVAITITDNAYVGQQFIHLAKNRAYGPIYGYRVGFEGNDGGGIIGPVAPEPAPPAGGPVIGTAKTGNVLVFERLGDDRKLQAANPELLQGKVSIAGAGILQEQVFDTIFNNAGNYTFFQKQGTSAGDVEDRAAPTLWVKGFGSKEDVDLENYTKVETSYYGALVGLDFDRQYTDNFDATYGLFVSYVGGELKDTEYNNKVKQSGGYAGLRANWYVGKLFINGILDYGMISNTADTTSDSNDFKSNVIGLAARVGYNFELVRRSFTIQPNLAITGKYIMTEDFKTKIFTGEEIEEKIDNIQNITVEPGVKLAKNLGECWILTGEGKYVIENVNGDIKVNELILPDTSYENYANVGLGIEKILGYTVLHLKANKTFGGKEGFIINAGVEFKF